MSSPKKARMSTLNTGSLTDRASPGKNASGKCKTIQKVAAYLLKISYVLLLFQRSILSLLFTAWSCQFGTKTRNKRKHNIIIKMKGTIMPFVSTVVFMADCEPTSLKSRHCNCINEYSCFKEYIGYNMKIFIYRWHSNNVQYKIKIINLTILNNVQANNWLACWKIVKWNRITHEITTFICCCVNASAERNLASWRFRNRCFPASMGGFCWHHDSILFWLVVPVIKKKR